MCLFEKALDKESCEKVRMTGGQLRDRTAEAEDRMIRSQSFNCGVIGFCCGERKVLRRTRKDFFWGINLLILTKVLFPSDLVWPFVD